jgi:hypothetical protein
MRKDFSPRLLPFPIQSSFLPFSVDRIIASGQLVGLQRADVVKILLNNFDEIFDTSSLLTALKNSIQSVIEDLLIETSDGNS